MAMDTNSQRCSTKILEKGLYNKPIGDEVFGGIPKILGKIKKINPSYKYKHFNRLDLAHALVSRDNPLTARVTVNRFWQSIFGREIVKSIDDFGVQGDKPTNQKLIDCLL